MRVSGTLVSLAAHVAAAVAVLHGSTAGHGHSPPAIVMVPLSRPPSSPHSSSPASPPTVPDAARWAGEFTLPAVPDPAIAQPVAAPTVFWWDSVRGRFLAGAPEGLAWPAGPIGSALTDDPPAMLAGPVPAYPPWLRQAGIEGRVVLEAVVDTVGGVEPGSIVVVTAEHAAFAAAAAAALAGSVFRPGRLRGRAVRVRVRVPFDFVLRGGPR